MAKGFVIGATGSGTGKTTVSMALMACLAARGVKVAPFKIGPDFIDPGLHTKISGTTSFNLDSWMLPEPYNRDLFRRKIRQKDLAVVEGVMGLFDGYDALSEQGSTAHMAKLLNLPVLLVVSAKGKARSAAAIVRGFETFDPDLTFCGVIFAQAGSQRHYQYLKDAVEQNCTTPCLGYLPKNENIVMPERHLGLVTADEMVIPESTLSLMISMVEDHIDVDRLMEVLPDIPSAPEAEPQLSAGAPSPRARIAVARDRAFCFYYPDNFEILEKAGAELVFFSPLEADSLPPDIDGLYLGGGYPELNADILAAKKQMLSEIRAASRSGMPIYGECGGFMVLCREVSGWDGGPGKEMCGIFDFTVQMSKRLRSLGYREITLTRDTLLGSRGDSIRGHEFHYSSICDESMTGEAVSSAENVYQVASRAGQEISLKGFARENTLGSYLHVHFGSNPKAAESLVRRCAQFRSRKTRSRQDPAQ